MSTNMDFISSLSTYDPVGSTLTAPNNPSVISLPGSNDDTSGGASDWLSGLGSLFGSVANGVSNIVKATNVPTPSPVYALPQSVYTPSNVNPSLTSVTSLLFNPVVLILLAVFGFLLLKKK